MIALNNDKAKYTRRVMIIIILGILSSWVCINGLTLLQLGMWSWPWPWITVILWQSGFQVEWWLSFIFLLVCCCLAWGWYRGGVARWLAYGVGLSVVMAMICTSIALVCFDYRTGIGVPIMPWFLLQTIMLLKGSSSFYPLLLQYLWISYLLGGVIGCLLGLLIFQRDTTLGDAKFANPIDIQRAKLYSQEGIFIGQGYGKSLYLPGFESALVMAPTGSGKTTCIGIPNLLSWQGSVVVNDLKGELYKSTHRYRKSVLHQTCYCFSPTGLVKDSHAYNPFAYVRVNTIDFLRDLQLIAFQWIQTLPQEARFWSVNSRELFVLCALYCFEQEGECTFRQLYCLARQQDFIEWLSFECERQQVQHPLFYQYASSLIACDEKTRSNILKDFHSRLELFSDERICQATDKHEIDIESLRKTGMSIYLRIPEGEQARLSPLLTLFYAQLISLLSQQEPDIEKEPFGVLLLLDEFGNMGKIPQLKAGVSFLRSYRIRTVMMVQYLGQIVSVYGQTDAKAFLNSKVKVIFSLTDIDDAHYIAKSLGQKTIKVRQHSTSSGHGEHGPSVSHSVSLQSRCLLSPDKLMRLPKKDSLIIVEGQYPIKAKKIHWRQCGTWRKLMKEYVT